jgi:riboflavin biosynthesis pyrimidine reductase
MTRRPFVHVNFAVGADGTYSGAISTEADWRRVHTLRERYGHVAVGAGTWNADRPALTCRLERLGRAPANTCRPVVFGGRWPLEAPARPGVIPLVLGPTKPRFSAEHHTCNTLNEALATIDALGIERLFVEGGPTLIRDFLRHDAIDVFTIFVPQSCPKKAAAAVSKTFPELSPPRDWWGLDTGLVLSWCPVDAAMFAAARAA